ncbi:hypothetical protein EA473_13785 [Natrarchaeobius chitinivorans]|uniref:Uncharacterized protein n=1 Tax=Natrarchaeobius chitinivorans TaxID=1679083 RepID=A0A3N6LXX8_NATCH|nr:hypothetical protein EA473_13785 [Natrarchaeobius chitinivorans]
MLFVTLLREEWRLHTRLFGGWRFALFPVVIAGLSVAASVALLETGTPAERIGRWGHVLALGFGLYSGTAAFAGSDMLENVFGRLSLVLSTSSTLPLSRKRLLSVFLVKDGLFYALVVVLPMAMAAVPFGELSGSTPVTVLGYWLSLSLVFAFGMAVTVALVAVRSRGVPTVAVLGGLGTGAVAAIATGSAGTVRRLLVPLEAATVDALVLGLVTVIVAVGALATYDPTYGTPTRTASDRFARLSDTLPVGDDALVAKTLLDLARSSGGVWKPFVSAGILLALVAALVGVVDAITGIEPAPGVFFGGVLGLSAFTTYNWLTQFDSLEAYLVYPVSVEAVFRAKRTAFVLVGVPTVGVPYLVAVVWFDATAVDAGAGAMILAGYALYYYGLTVYLAGFSPNEFLFDAVRFATFTAGVALPLVPTLVAGFVVVPPSTTVAVGLALAGIGFAIVGYALSSRAGPRWERRLLER